MQAAWDRRRPRRQLDIQKAGETPALPDLQLSRIHKNPLIQESIYPGRDDPGV